MHAKIRHSLHFERPATGILEFIIYGVVLLAPERYASSRSTPKTKPFTSDNCRATVSYLWVSADLPSFP